jgi:hypothetical protein
LKESNSSKGSKKPTGTINLTLCELKSNCKESNTLNAKEAKLKRKRFKRKIEGITLNKKRKQYKIIAFEKQLKKCNELNS